jgi:uncharacterized membrane protein
MRTISKIFLTGLLAILPISVTVYILYFLVTNAESELKSLLEKLLPNTTAYFPGMGIVLFVVVVLIIGFLLRSWVFRRIFSVFDRVVKKIPLVKTLYGAVTDLVSLFSGSDDRGLTQVVMVTLANDVRLIGFLTREDFSDLPDGIGDENTVAVYLPMSYQLGGFTTMVPRDSCETIDMSLEAAMRFAIAAGVQEKKIGG